MEKDIDDVYLSLLAAEKDFKDFIDACNGKKDHLRILYSGIHKSIIDFEAYHLGTKYDMDKLNKSGLMRNTNDRRF